MNMFATSHRVFLAAFLLVLVGTASAELVPTWFDYSRQHPVSLAAAPDFSAAAGETPVRLPDEWTNETLRLVIKYQLNPVRASRVLAYVHAAMDDALQLATSRGIPENAAVIAVHRAASVALGYLFPQESMDRIEARGFALAYRESGDARLESGLAAKSWLVGNQVAAALIARARDDGSDATWNPNDRPAAAPRIWRAAPPLNSYNPMEPLAGQWRTWSLKDGNEVAPPPPVEFDSEAYKKEWSEVKDVSDKLTAGQTRIADDWNLDLGTITPGGVWNRIALEAATTESFDLRRRMRMLAVLNATVADAFIACWQAKFTWWTVRPINIIQERSDPKFSSHILTPAFPSYPSGHATVSGAAARILGHFIPKREASFREMAQEAAMSRLYGGIHFRSDNDNGLELGRKVAQIALERRQGANQPGK